MKFNLTSENINRIVMELREKGISMSPGVFSKQECHAFVDLCERIMEDRYKGVKFPESRDAENIWNFFRYDECFMPLVFNPLLDAVMKSALDENYTLIAANIINRQLRGNGGASSYANDWHTDSRYLGGKRLAAGFNYQMVVMLEDFTRDNGCTEYVPGSHLVREIPERLGDYKNAMPLLGETGTVVFFDSGNWHRGGRSGVNSRWSVFNMYGPWFMKPYFRYFDMFSEEEKKRLSPELKKMFHFNSIPPLDESEGELTLKKTI